jgi:hypothetical protein
MFLLSTAFLAVLVVTALALKFWVTKNPDGCPPGPGNQLLIKVISPLCTTAL